MSPNKFLANLISDDIVNLDQNIRLIVNDRFECISCDLCHNVDSNSDDGAPTESSYVNFLAWDREYRKLKHAQIVVTYHRDLDITTSMIYLKDKYAANWEYGVNIVKIIPVKNHEKQIS